MEIRFPLILDGATGTELQKHGYAGDVSAEQWTLAHPDILREIQRGYVAAGSQVLYTPTFGANRQKLEEAASSTARRILTAALPRSRAKRRTAGHGSRAISRRRVSFSPRSVRHRSRIWSTSTPSRLPVSRKPGSTCSSLRR